MDNQRGRGRGRGRGARNPYWYFVEEMRQQKRLGSWEQASKEAAPLWENLNKDARRKYVEKAKEFKGTVEKMTNTGLTVAAIRREQDLMRSAEESERKEIEKYVTGTFCDTSLKEFFIIHTNYYCCNNSGMYSTCEIGVTKFTLEHGINLYLHFIVDTDIPSGYNYKSQMKSNEIGLPMPPIKNAEKDHVEILSQLIIFLQSSITTPPDELPPVYAMPSDVESVTNFLQQLCFTSGESTVIRVYSLPNLFFELMNSIQKDAFPYESLALNYLSKDRHTYARGISCDTHKEGDYFHMCSLSIVRRLCFTICEHCCPLMNIDLIPDHHAPSQVSGSRSDSSQVPTSSCYLRNKDDVVSSGSFRSQSPSDFDDEEFTTVSRSKRKH